MPQFLVFQTRIETRILLVEAKEYDDIPRSSIPQAMPMSKMVSESRSDWQVSDITFYSEQDNLNTLDRAR